MSELCEHHRFDEAAAALAQLTSEVPDDAEAWSLLAQARLGQRDYAQTLEAARVAMSLDPDDPWPHLLASFALGGLGLHDEAAAAVEKAVSLNPHSWFAYMRLADALTRVEGRAAGAHLAADQALRLAPDDADAHVGAGTVAAALGKRGQAAEAFRRALAIEPEHAVAHEELARLSAGSVQERHDVRPARRSSMAARARRAIGRRGG